MTDAQIVALYWSRSNDALQASETAFGAYCRALAERFVSAEDAWECWNDALLRAWNAIPPERPKHLRAFLARLTRNAALDRRRSESAAKRGGGESDAVLDELSELLSGSESAESAVTARELGEAVSRFARSLPRRECDVLVRRCFFCDTTAEIAARYGMTENAVKVTLSRARKKLRKHLESEGYL